MLVESWFVELPGFVATSCLMPYIERPGVFIKKVTNTLINKFHALKINLQVLLILHPKMIVLDQSLADRPQKLSLG